MVGNPVFGHSSQGLAELPSLTVRVRECFPISRIFIDSLMGSKADYEIRPTLTLATVPTDAEPDHLTRARFIRPSDVSLEFEDGTVGLVSLAELGLDLRRLRSSSIRASSCGGAMEVEDRQGRTIHVDSSVLRTRIDHAFRSELKRAITAFQSEGAPVAPPPVTVSDQSRLDRLVEARPVGVSRVFLRFADGHKGTWSFRKLELDMSDMQVASIKVSSSGTSMEVKSKKRERVEIDSSSLRALVDPGYKAELDKALGGLLNDELRTHAAKNRPPQWWYDGDEDLC